MRELVKQLSGVSFKIGFRGYLPGQVDAFLDSLQEQARNMDSEMSRLEHEIERYRVMASKLAELSLNGAQISRALAAQKQERPIEATAPEHMAGGDEVLDVRAEREQRMELAIRKLYFENKRLKAENLQLKATLHMDSDIIIEVEHDQ